MITDSMGFLAFLGLAVASGLVGLASMPLSMTKIAYRSSSLDNLRKWVEAGDEAHMTTRYLPKRHDEMIGGSLYWIIEHAIVARSEILGFEQREDRRWTIRLAPQADPGPPAGQARAPGLALPRGARRAARPRGRRDRRATRCPAGSSASSAARAGVAAEPSFAARAVCALPDGRRCRMTEARPPHLGQRQLIASRLRGSDAGGSTGLSAIPIGRDRQPRPRSRNRRTEQKEVGQAHDLDGDRGRSA